MDKQLTNNDLAAIKRMIDKRKIKSHDNADKIIEWLNTLDINWTDNRDNYELLINYVKK